MDSLAKSQFTFFFRLLEQVDCHAGWGSVEVRTLADRKDCLRAIHSCAGALAPTGNGLGQIAEQTELSALGLSADDAHTDGLINSSSDVMDAWAAVRIFSVEAYELSGQALRDEQIPSEELRRILKALQYSAGIASCALSVIKFTAAKWTTQNYEKFRIAAVRERPILVTHRHLYEYPAINAD